MNAAERAERDRLLAELDRAHRSDDHPGFRASMIQFMRYTTELVETMSEQLADLAERTPTKRQLEDLRADELSRSHWAWVGRNLTRTLGGLAFSIGALLGLLHVMDWIQAWRDKP